MKLFETERLIIRKWRQTDAADLFKIYSNVDITRFLPVPAYTNIEAANQYIEQMQKDYKNYIKERIYRIDFAIELKNEGKVIGSIDWAGYRKRCGGIVRVGYVLIDNFQGSRYENEALLGMFKYIKRKKFAMRIEAHHDIENSASGEVLKNIGMTFEGVRRKAGHNNYGSRRDMATYSILFEEIK